MHKETFTGVKMKILLVSDDKVLIESLKEKLVFLRKDDEISVSSYKNALQNIELSSANIVLVHENTDKEDTIFLIKEFRKNRDLPVILLVNSLAPEFILNSIDAGANDYILVSSEDFEFVIRLVNYIKHASIKNLYNKSCMLLEQMNVINELSGFYEYAYSKQVIENAIDSELMTEGSFMVISPSKAAKTKFSSEALSNSIKLSVRSEDIVAHGKGTNFYIFMPDTDLNGAICVFEKIKEKLGFEICAGICGISGKSYNKFEKKALKALTEAVATNASVKFAEEEQKETLDEWLDGNETKNYKIFRQMFNKKLEKVITPVFYRLQKAYEEKLFDTKIDQYVNEEHCVFTIHNRNISSSLSIIYPGFNKIIISITHDGLDSPENREIQLPLAKVSQQELVDVIENFIKEFKSRG